MPKLRPLPSDALRILYLAGPGDAVDVLRTFAKRRSFDSIAHVAYSLQMYEVCHARGAQVLALATNSRVDDFTFGTIRAINIENPLSGKSGLGYHLAHLKFAKIVFKHARQFKANVVVTATEPYPFLLEPLALRGIHVIPALHALLLPAHRKPTVLQQGAVRLSRHFFSTSCSAILSHPGAAVEQVLDLTRMQPRPVVEFLPLYPQATFAKVAPPNPSADVFRVITVGRCEEAKGVFDLIEVARRIRDLKGDRVRFDVCGAGSALEPARSRVLELGLTDTVTLHGWTEMDHLERLWGESHVAVVPTTSRFVEGFNQVIVEAVIAGRPVITSKACPALDFVRPCAIEVRVDNVDDYFQALLALCDSRERYTALQQRCTDVAKPFFDEGKSFRAALRHIFTGITSSGSVSSVAQPPTV